MAWAKTTLGAYLRRTPIVLPSNHWAQVDVWVPSSVLTGCDDSDGGGDSANLLTGSDSIFLTDIAYPNGTWRLETDYGHIAPALTTNAAHTIKYHYSAGTVTWYVDGTLVATDTGVNLFSQLLLGWGGNTCGCSTYFFTDVRVGTSDGGTDIFSDNFSGGLGNWTVGGQAFSSVAVVSSPADSCPLITLSPTQGQGGQLVHVHGTGFAPSSPLTLHFGTIPIDFSAATTDSDGNVTGTFLAPHQPAGTAEFQNTYSVYLGDAQANVATADFIVCGNTNADAISSEPDPYLLSAGVPVDPRDFNSGTVLAYIRHAGAHWVAWTDGSTSGYAGNTGPPNYDAIPFSGIFPPPANRTLMLTKIDDDGSTTDFEIDTDYQWNFGSGGVGDPGLFCTVDCHGSSVNRPVWSNRFFFASWSKPIIDIELASDGETLWVALLTRETVIYPWISTDDGPCGYPPSIAQFVDLSTLTHGFTSFATSQSTGYLRYYVNPTGAINFYRNTAFPVTDNGEANSGHWSPPRIVMFAGGDTGFSRIGQVDAKYYPGETTGWDNGKGAGSFIGTPRRVQAGPRGSFLSGLSIAASDAEPGVCHLVWSEGGDWGPAGEGTCDGPAVWDGGAPNRSYRLCYSTWDSASKTGEHDLWDAHIDRTAWYFDYAYDGTVYATGYSWPDQDHMRATGMHAVRNEHGSPVLFLAWQRSIQNPANFTSAAGFGTPDTPPDNSDRPWLDNALVNGEPTVHMYDISGGSPALLQEITPNLLPTEEEMEFFAPLNPSRGIVAPETPTALNGGINGYGGGGASDRAFMLSFLYEDPLLDGQPVYLLGVPWHKSIDAQVFAGDYPVRCFYRVPVDGSAPFDFLDGERQLQFTIFNESSSSGRASFGSEDFYSDPKTIWCPNTRWDGAGFFSAYYGVQYDRICVNGWAPYTLVPGDTYPGNHIDRITYVPFGAAGGFYHNPDTDTISYVGAGPTIDSEGNSIPFASQNVYSVLTLELCRGCVQCPCMAEGIHAFLRFGRNR